MNISFWQRRLRLMLVMMLCGSAGILWTHRLQAQTAEDITWRVAVVSATTLFMLTNPLHADRMTLEGGTAEDVDVARIGFQWDMEDNVMQVLGFDLDIYIQADYSKWQSRNTSSQEGANNTLGVTPVFRFTREMDSFTPYIDTAIGFYLFSQSKINDDTNLGSNFQFGDMLSFGALFGERRQWGLSYKFQHFSNNSLKIPNNGINLHFLTLTYEYQPH